MASWNIRIGARLIGLSASVLTAVTSLLLTVPELHAQGFAPKENRAKVRLVHTPIRPHEMPIAGHPINLVVHLRPAKDTSRVLRMIYSRDGNFQDVSVQNAYLNEYDVPTYEIQIPAPVTTLRYQFLLSNPDGSYKTTQEFVLARSCLPSIEPVEIDIPKELKYEEKLQVLVSRTRQIDREYEAYLVALKLAEQLAKTVGE